MKLSKTIRPRILLIGIGHFGIHHLHNLQNLDREGKIELAGVLVHSEKSRKIAEKEGVKIFMDLTVDLLKQVDAVDIVTPPSTHFEIAKKCLSYVDIFLEKPITLSIKEGLELNNIAKKNNRILFLGHIYRFHPSLAKLKEIINKSKEKAVSLECIFSDKPEKVTQDCGVLYSDLHGFDIVDYLFEEEPEWISAKGKKKRQDSAFEDEVTTVLEYPSGLKATIKLTWNILPKTRKLLINFPDKKIDVDLVSQEIFILKDGGKEKIKCSKEMPLSVELNHFIKVIKGEENNYPDAVIGTRIVNIASIAEQSMRENKTINYTKI